MLKYILKRLLALIPIVLVMSMLVFGLSALSSGDAARVLAEHKYEHPTQTQIEEMRHEYGLDRPIYERYATWLGKICHGDFGESYQTMRPALEEVQKRLPVTLKLAAMAFVILLAAAVPLGILSAFYENRWLDKVIQVLTFLSVSMPEFWIGLMLLYLFGVKWKLIPVIGNATNVPVLAAITLDIGYFGILIRLIRTNLSEVLHQGYIRAARAKGLPEYLVVIKHGLKNAVLPVITRLSSMCVSLICGSAVIESIYSIQGIGNLALESVYTQDLPVLQCFILLLTCFVVVMNLLVDILYSVIDARIQIM